MYFLDKVSSIMINFDDFLSSFKFYLQYIRTHSGPYFYDGKEQCISETMIKDKL